MSTLTQDWLEKFESLDVELDNAEAPKRWIEQGFGPEVAQRWMAAGAFTAEGAKQLVDMGYDRSEVSHIVSFEEAEEHSLSYNGYSIAYMWCNGDLSKETLKALID